MYWVIQHGILFSPRPGIPIFLQDIHKTEVHLQLYDHFISNNYQFTLILMTTLHGTRVYNSFDEMAVDVGRSGCMQDHRLYLLCVEGKKTREKIAQNVLNILKFKKE